MVSLEFLWKTYDLEITRSVYQNGRTYLGLYEPSSWEPFADITENHVEVSDEDIYGRIPWCEALVIDNDFMNCFPSERECKIWIRDNVKSCVITWDIDWLPVFYIKKEN